MTILETLKKNKGDWGKKIVLSEGKDQELSRRE